MTGGYFRALEALVQGEGWEGNPHPEGPVTGVLTLTGSGERGPFYGMWTGILSGKNRRGNLKQVVVEWADHVWTNKVHCIPKADDFPIADLLGGAAARLRVLSCNAANTDLQTPSE